MTWLPRLTQATTGNSLYLPQPLRNRCDSACHPEVDRDLSPVVIWLGWAPSSEPWGHGDWAIVSKGDSRLRDSRGPCSLPSLLNLDLSSVLVPSGAQSYPDGGASPGSRQFLVFLHSWTSRKIVHLLVIMVLIIANTYGAYSIPSHTLT